MIANFPQLTQQFTFSSSVLELMGGLAPIYYAIRYLDKPGTGELLVSTEVLASLIKRTEGTVINQLYRLKQAGYAWQAHKVSPGIFKVSYKSETRILGNHGIRNLGTCARTSIIYLPHWRQLSTQAVAESLQKVTLHKAGVEVSKSTGSNLRVPDIDTLFVDWLGSQKSRGFGHLATGKQCIYLSEQFVPIGGKQATIAEQQGLSLSTIKRRLGKNQPIGAPPLEKHQLAIRSPLTEKIIENMKLAAIETSDLNLFQEAQRYFVQSINGVRQVFYACTNVYNALCIELSRQRHKRFKLKKLSLEARPAQAAT